MREKLERRPPLNRRAVAAAAALLTAIGLSVGGDATEPPPPVNQYDVVVVGAGPGGIAASLQAARMGAHVALLEETDWIGGQMTAAGVGTMDEGSPRARNHGIYKEFSQRAAAFYKEHGKSVNTCYFGGNNLCVDPKVGQTILRQMLGQQSDRLQVFTDTRVSQVLKQGDTVTGVVANNRQFSSKVVIDAGEYGDVLAQAGADYRIGNGTCTAPKTDACIQNITYVGIMKQYPEGVPDNLRFKQPPPGYNAKIAAHFARFVTPNGNDHLVKPTNPLSPESYNAYRGLPDLDNPDNYDGRQEGGRLVTRTSLNGGNDYPLGGVLSTKFLTDSGYRQQATCGAKLLTLQMVYYLQHDLGQSTWSLANDEGYNTPYSRRQACPNLKGLEAFEEHLPRIPYVRESRRIIGTQTLAGHHLRDRQHTPRFPNSIAVGYYPMDVHGCDKSAQLESQFDRTSDWSSRGGPFEVPMGVLIPERVNGLLAAEKNISVSRLAGGATREQPISMDIGQSAGALAALSVQQHVPLRDVHYGVVQRSLLAAGEPFSLPG